MDCIPPGSSVRGDFLGKKTGVDCHTLLQGISQPRDRTRVSYIAQILFHLSHQKSPGNLMLHIKWPSIARESEWGEGLGLIIMIICLPLLSVQPLIHFFTAAHSLGLTDSELSRTMLEQDSLSAGPASPNGQASFLRWPYMLVNLVFASCLGIFINSTSFLPVKVSLAEKQSMWSPYWFPFLLPFLTSTSITTQVCQDISDFTGWLEELTRSKLENFQQNLIHVILPEVQEKKTEYILIFIGSTHGHTPVSKVSPILNCT